MRGKLIALSICGILGISGCGGGGEEGGGESPVPDTLGRAEVIKGVAVPKAPKDDTSIAGTDANGNGIRDDVERLLGSRFGARGQAELRGLARLYQAFLVAPVDDPTSLRRIWNAIRAREACLSADLVVASAEKWVRYGTLSTIPRARAYNARIRAIQQSPDGLPTLSTSCVG